MTDISLEQFGSRLNDLSTRVDDQARVLGEITPELARINERLETIATDTHANGEGLERVRSEVQTTNVELQKTRTDLQASLNKILLAILGAALAAIVSVMIAWLS